MSRTTLTKKQIQIMAIICRGIGKEEFTPVDMTKLLKLLPYKTTRHSMQFSLRRLVMRNLISVAYEKRGEPTRHHKVIFPTEEGRTLYRQMK